MATPKIAGQTLGVVTRSDLLAALSPQLDITTGIQPSQRVAGAFPQWTGTVWVWSDYSTDSGVWLDSTIWVDANLWSDN